jgi:predicted PurR-regulated permease PerM
MTIAAQALSVLGLIAILELHILSALLSGLLIYQIATMAVRKLNRTGVTPRFSALIVTACLIAIIGLALAFGAIQIVSLANHGSDSVAALLQKMAELIESARHHLPAWAQDYVPTSVDELDVVATDWLRRNASELSPISQNVGRFLFHMLVGMVVGGLVAFRIGPPNRHLGSLSFAMIERVKLLNGSFRSIVLSQIRISALNTVLTAIYLAGILPLLGIHLPLVKTMIAVAFIVGLLPIFGNLISNTIIVVVSLSASPIVAVGSLAFLILIHKLEYFVNARIIGARIRARAWELLLAMLAMEAAFGVAGLISAPIYYAYMKDELSVWNLL